MFYDGSHVTCNEIAALAVTDEQRRILACSDEMLRLVDAQYAQRIRALYTAQHAEHSLERVAAFGIIKRDELSHDLGIGLGSEVIALRDEKIAKLDIVFDYAVVNYGDLTVTAQMRVSVNVVRLAVRRPACVSDADGTVDAFAALDHITQYLKAALGLFYSELFVIGYNCDAGRVIATVFQSLKSVKQYGYCLLASYEANYSAHKNYSFRIIYLVILNDIIPFYAPLCNKTRPPISTGGLSIL